MCGDVLPIVHSSILPHPPTNPTAPLPILAASTTPGSSTAVALSKLKWTVLTDRSIGGKSEATFQVHAPPPHQQAAREEEHTGGTDAGREGEIQEARENSDDRPLAVFSGQLSMLRPSTDPRYVRCLWECAASTHPHTTHLHPPPPPPTKKHSVKRTGYCAVKIEFPRPLKIENYEGLELKVRTDGRNYVTNLEVRGVCRPLLCCCPPFLPDPSTHSRHLGRQFLSGRVVPGLHHGLAAGQVVDHPTAFSRHDLDALGPPLLHPAGARQQFYPGVDWVFGGGRQERGLLLGDWGRGGRGQGGGPAAAGSSSNGRGGGRGSKGGGGRGQGEGGDKREARKMKIRLPNESLKELTMCFS